MDAPFIGTVTLFAGNFAPVGWAFCQGQIMPISTNEALFSILGITYGGNGQTNFALPDLRGRAPVGFGQGPGLSSYDLGEQVGVENVSLTLPNLPSHNHNVMVSTSDANSATGKNNYLAVANGNIAGDAVTVNTYNGTPNGTLGPASISSTGNNLPHDNIQPSLVMNYIICLEGLYPTRN